MECVREENFVLCVIVMMFVCVWVCVCVIVVKKAFLHHRTEEQLPFTRSISFPVQTMEHSPIHVHRRSVTPTERYAWRDRLIISHPLDGSHSKHCVDGKINKKLLGMNLTFLQWSLDSTSEILLFLCDRNIHVVSHC